MTVTEKPGARRRVEVRAYTLDHQGKLEELSCYPLTYYGSCPDVGDTILDDITGLEPTFYTVQRRFFVQESLIFSGWALILREIDRTGPPQALWDEWKDATEFWDDAAEKQEEEYFQALQDRLASLTKPAPKAKKSIPTKTTRPNPRNLPPSGAKRRKLKPDA